MHHGSGGRSGGREWGQEKDKEEIKRVREPAATFGARRTTVILLIAY